MGPPKSVSLFLKPLLRDCLSGAGLLPSFLSPKGWVRQTEHFLGSTVIVGAGRCRKCISRGQRELQIALKGTQDGGGRLKNAQGRVSLVFLSPRHACGALPRRPAPSLPRSLRSAESRGAGKGRAGCRLVLPGCAPSSSPKRQSRGWGGGPLNGGTDGGSGSRVRVWITRIHPPPLLATKTCK